jgi:MoxR-like ATPase
MTSPEFIEDDPAVLAAYVASLRRGLVAFDGRPGAGKTHFARMVAQQIGASAVDAFLMRKQDMFLGSAAAGWIVRATKVTKTSDKFLTNH